jgi:hypothetical protein
MGRIDEKGKSFKSPNELADVGIEFVTTLKTIKCKLFISNFFRFYFALANHCRYCIVHWQLSFSLQFDSAEPRVSKIGMNNFF